VAYAPVKRLKPYGVPVNVRSERRILSSPAVVGTTGAYLDVMSFRVGDGRFLSEEDDRLCRRVCVLEYDTKRELWPTGPAVGEWLYVDNEPYEVVGVLRRKHTGEEKFELASEPAGTGGETGRTASAMQGPAEAGPASREEKGESDAESLWESVVAEWELNRRIYIPLSCALTRTTQSKKESEIDEAIFRTRGIEDLPVAKDVILRFLLAAHNMLGVGRDGRDFRVEVPLDLIRQKQENQRIFNWVIGATAGISLLVGGIGIMNIMLANLGERRREIGIRRAVGATETDILRQFIVEAVGICVFGGVAGVLVGLLMSSVVSWLAGYRTAIALWGVLIALVVSIADGVAFGTYPAWKAAKLDPIEALRVE
jgi:putative ABC transport system permease protein